MSDADAARKVRLLALDVDGVLTDNAVYLGLVDGQRVEFKRFDIQDGLGLGLLRGGPIEVAWVSGRMSDDLADVAMLRRVGLPIAVANAVPEVKALARYVTKAEGGKGAVREAVTWLLGQRGEWDAAVDRYVSKRSG